MNTAHWHLLLNHLPVIGVVIGTLILVAGLLLKNDTVKRTALGVFVFSALMAIPAYLTGEGAEDIAEKMPGVTESGIENHEELGSVFLAMVSALGLLSLLAFAADMVKNKAKSILYLLVLVMAVSSVVSGKLVATSGGEVRHTEIRSDTLQQQGAGGEEEKDKKGESDDD